MTLSDADIMRQLMSTFIDEANEHLDALNRQLLDLEKSGAQGDQALLEDIFRDAHSLKGAARAVDATTIEATAHGLESVFSAKKCGKLEFSAEVYDLLYQAIDQISSDLKMLTAVDGGEPSADSALLARLAEITDPDAADRKKSEPVREKKGYLPGSSRPPQSNRGHEETVRVSTKKLDALMTHVEELLVSKIRTEQRVAELKEIKDTLSDWQKSWFKSRGTYDRLRRQPAQGDLSEMLGFLSENQENLKQMWLKNSDLLQDFSKDSTRISLITEDLQEDIRKVRMLPVATLFESYKRMVRDLAKEQNKQVELVIEGEQTEIDKKLIEGIKDPLMHILRNSVDHGIEDKATRNAAGKPAVGTIWLRAGQQGNAIKVEVEDDGRGLNTAKIKKAALEKRVITPQEEKTISDEDVRFLIFQSGFSTASEVTNVSGRGVGLDVVKTNIEELNGLVSIDGGARGGTKLSFTLPLTLSTSRVLLVKCADQSFAIPTSAVERIIRIDRDEVFTVGNRDAIRVGERSMSLIKIADALGLEELEEDRHESQKLSIIILGAAEKRVAFAVGGLLGETEIVIKSLGKMLSRVRNISGATILGNGKVVMILNITDLIKSARRYGTHDQSRIEPGGGEARVRELVSTPADKHILIVDDSITTRILEKNILESAGYDVTLAKDGVEAFENLQEKPFDLMIADIEMPRMDGFELTTKVKKDQGLGGLPIILVTALDSAADRERGLDSGADAYIVKHSFDQKNLLEAIEQLI